MIYGNLHQPLKKLTTTRIIKTHNLFTKHQYKLLVTAIVVLLLSSCIKVPVDFGSEVLTSDPNITLIDTLSVEVSTLQLDSFKTNNTYLFIVGKHTDPALGNVEARSYFEITAPVNDLANCTNCVFDSIEFRAKLTGGFYGDTSAPFTFSIHQLSQIMDEDVASVGFNISNCSYNPLPLVSKTLSIRPSNKADLKVNFPAPFGQELFNFLKRNSDTITNRRKLLKYFKGLCIVGDTSDNAMYYMNPYDSGSSVIRLHYKIAGATPVSKYVDFKSGNNQHQFNSFTCDKTGTAPGIFTPKRRQLKSSSLMGNKGFLHNNSGLYPKITLTNLFSIKELYPYVKVIKAEIEIRPASGTYGNKTFYRLPPQMNLYPVDEDNYINGSAINGNLDIDNLYGKDTKYTYDVTPFVNIMLTEGRASKRGLQIMPAITTENQRLIINDKTGSNPIQLKLYIIGL
jgi:hypothetical protein